HVQSSGEPSSVNIKDPQFAQQQMATAAQVQQKVREAQARSGKPVPKAAATQEEYMEQQKKLAEDMQKGHAACKGDTNCLMKLGQEYAQQSSMLSYPPADGAAPAANLDASLEDGEEAPEEERYVDYSGYEGCPGEIQIRVNNTSEGAMADVSGMIPFKQADTADYPGSEHDLMMQCLASTLVYDLKERKIYSDGIGHPAPRGSYYYWDSLHGETLNEEAHVPTTSVAWEWVAKNLRIADASGSASTTLPIPEAGEAPATDGSQLSGEIKVDMKWSFEPL
ncbi:MAG TPA: hypothetical protein VJN01_13755, partial [Xanthomonadales bacterium]|nr:hypothetical protein [Xanthomonadales bacterium]